MNLNFSNKNMSEYFAHIRNDDAKQKQLLLDHLVEVSKKCCVNASKLNMPETGYLLGILHDLGKFSKSFQGYIRSVAGLISKDAENYLDALEYKGKIDHSTAGSQFIWNIFKNSKDLKEQIAAQVIALCIASHHSGLIDCVSPDGENVFIGRMSKDEQKTFLNEVLVSIDKEILEKIKGNINKAEFTNEIINFIKKIQNKYSSNELIIRFQAALMIKMLFSCLIDADHTDTANFESQEYKSLRNNNFYPEWDTLIKKFNEYLNKLPSINSNASIDDIRKKISEECFVKADGPVGVYTLTVPTGGGKTLSSLRFGLNHAKKHRLDRIFYIIPFTTIIEQNAQVVREILETSNDEAGRIVLEHHSNLILEQISTQNKILAENWDAPIVFTTNVQFLETFFGSGTRSARRMHQLANSVIIFDEIQALPVKTVHLFCNAINFLVNFCNSSVVLCTATQPLLNKVSQEKGHLEFSDENEIISNVPELFSALKRVEIINRTKPKGWEIHEIVKFALENAMNSGSCMVIVNTKESAKELYKECKDFQINIYHLSTNMCPAHRLKVLKTIKQKLNSNEPLICISTQLIEAGVDIDFGSVIRYVAGLDSIAQAAGRCNRNGKREIGYVYILNPIEEKINRLIDIKIGKETTERILREIGKNDFDILHPAIMAKYFQYYFYERADEMDYKVKNDRDDTLLNMLSKNDYAVNEHVRKFSKNPDIYFRQSFMTAFDAFRAIDAPTQGIIVPYEDGEHIISELFSEFAYEKRFQLLKKAQRYTVNVFPNVLDKLLKEKVVIEVPEIGVIVLNDKRYYHLEFGLNFEKATAYEFLNL